MALLLLSTTLLAAEPQVMVTTVSGEAVPALGPCFTTPPPRFEMEGAAGRAVFEIRVRRGRVAIVSTTTIDPRLEPLRSCFERELAAWDWGVRRATIALPLQIAPVPEAPGPAVEPVGPSED